MYKLSCSGLEMRIKKIYTFTLALFLFLLAITYLLLHQQNTVDLRCNSFLNLRNNKGNFDIKANFEFRFNKDGSGLLLIDGNSYFNDQPRELRKNITFHYSHLNNDLYRVTKLAIDAPSRDATDNRLINDNFFPTDNKSMKLIALSKVDGMWLIGSSFTPAFMCVITQ